LHRFMVPKSMANKPEKKEKGRARNFPKQRPTVIPARKPGKPKVHADQLDQLELAGSTQLGEYLKIMICGPKGQQQITIHHPIGYTTLRGDDWVLTPSYEVPELLARADHPEAGARARFIEQQYDERGFAQGLLVQGPGGKFHPVTGKSITQMNADLKTNKFNKPEEYATYVAVVEMLQEIKQKCIAEAPKLDLYETKRGPNRDVPQCAVPALRGKTIDQVSDYFSTLVMAAATQESEPCQPAPEIKKSVKQAFDPATVLGQRYTRALAKARAEVAEDHKINDLPLAVEDQQHAGTHSLAPDKHKVQSAVPATTQKISAVTAVASS